MKILTERYKRDIGNEIWNKIEKIISKKHPYWIAWEDFVICNEAAHLRYEKQQYINKEIISRLNYLVTYLEMKLKLIAERTRDVNSQYHAQAGLDEIKRIRGIIKKIKEDNHA